MEDINEYVFNITVKTSKKFGVVEKWLVAYDFMARLEGYTTKCPKELVDADIAISIQPEKDSPE